MATFEENIQWTQQRSDVKTQQRRKGEQKYISVAMGVYSNFMWEKCI